MICTENTSARSEQCSVLMELMALKCVQLLTRHCFVQVGNVAFMTFLLGYSDWDYRGSFHFSFLRSLCW